MEKKQKKCSCPHCAKRAQEDERNEEFNFALLLALVPLMVFTFFGQMGLF
ncbi:MAG TPA: hypothetical protein PLB52_03225 [Candidatus Moranbacteria bacterium]|nr:hypothetical protein [Candidatus Moranbacteria bacterium]